MLKSDTHTSNDCDAMHRLQFAEWRKREVSSKHQMNKSGVNLGVRKFAFMFSENHTFSRDTKTQMLRF